MYDILLSLPPNVFYISEAVNNFMKAIEIYTDMVSTVVFSLDAMIAWHEHA
jgi:hypothetical protein